MSARPNILHIPSLRSFIANSQSLALYRKALRATKGMNDSDRMEIRNIIRNEFDQSRDVKEKSHLSYLHTTGKRRIQRMFKSNSDIHCIVEGDLAKQFTV